MISIKEIMLMLDKNHFNQSQYNKALVRYLRENPDVKYTEFIEYIKCKFRSADLVRQWLYRILDFNKLDELVLRLTEVDRLSLFRAYMITKENDATLQKHLAIVTQSMNVAEIENRINYPDNLSKIEKLKTLGKNNKTIANIATYLLCAHIEYSKDSDKINNQEAKQLIKELLCIN